MAKIAGQGAGPVTFKGLPPLRRLALRVPSIALRLREGTFASVLMNGKRVMPELWPEARPPVGRTDGRGSTSPRSLPPACLHHPEKPPPFLSPRPLPLRRPLPHRVLLDPGLPARPCPARVPQVPEGHTGHGRRPAVLRRPSHKSSFMWSST